MARIGVLGAGAIGSYLGARLADAGCDVVLVGRQRLVDAIRGSGLHFEGLEGRVTRVNDSGLYLHQEARALKDCDCVLVTVKSGQTREAGLSLAAVLDKPSVIVSFQNGTSNARVLQEVLPDHCVLAGMVPFNVVWESPALFRQGTSGALVLQEGHAFAGELATLLEKAGLATELSRDPAPLQWGKLLMNLNNAINALSGQPLQQQLADRDYRICLAASQREALHLLKRAGISAASPLKLPLTWIPTLLHLPTPIFKRAARTMLKVAPDARSSMYDDLSRGRKTEIDVLNGEFVALAGGLDEEAPINTAIVALIHQAEVAAAGSPMLSGRVLRRALSL